MKKLLTAIYWFFARITPRGREAYFFYKAQKPLQQAHAQKQLTKIQIIKEANKMLKQKKMLNFFKGTSITKEKTTNHQIVEQVQNKYAAEMKQYGIKIDRKKMIFK